MIDSLKTALMTPRQPAAGFEPRSIQNPAVPLSSAKVLEYLGRGAMSASGESVTDNTALTYSPVWQALDLISGDVSRMDFVTYRRVSNQYGEGKERAKLHPSYKLLLKTPADDRTHMTSNIWVSRMLTDALLYGGGFSEIIRNRGGMPEKLLWRPARLVGTRLDGGKFRFLFKRTKEYDGREGLDSVAATDVFHLQGLTLDELGGKSIIQYARDTIGRLIASGRYGDDFFSNFGLPTGWFEVPEEMSQEAQAAFMSAVQDRHSGSGKRHKFGLLSNGMTWKPASVTPKDAMLVDMMQFGVKEISRYFNLPPHKLGDDSKTSYNSLEQENRSYFNSTLGKWVDRFESEANVKMFKGSEVNEDLYFCKFDVSQLFRADTKTRAESHEKAIQNGWKSPNEVRAEEDLNPVAGGEVFMRPLNMGEVGGDDGDVTVDEDRAMREKIAKRDAILDCCCRMLTRIENRAKRAAKKPNQFLAWVNNLQSEHRSTIESALQPIMRAAGFDDQDVCEFAGRLIDRWADEFLAASDCYADELPDMVGRTRSKLNEWCATEALELVTRSDSNETSTA